MIDPWTSHTDALDDGPPFAGRVALLVSAAAATGGVVLTAAFVVAGSWLRARLTWRAR